MGLEEFNAGDGEEELLAREPSDGAGGEEGEADRPAGEELRACEAGLHRRYLGSSRRMTGVVEGEVLGETWSSGRGGRTGGSFEDRRGGRGGGGRVEARSRAAVLIEVVGALPWPKGVVALAFPGDWGGRESESGATLRVGGYPACRSTHALASVEYCSTFSAPSIVKLCPLALLLDLGETDPRPLT